MSNNKENTVSTKYYIKGLHCASCELIIEKKLKKIADVVSADVSLAKGTLIVVTQGKVSYTPENLNTYFKKDGYIFSDKPVECGTSFCSKETSLNKYQPFLIAGIFLMGFYILQRTGLASLISVNSQSALPFFFLFGLLAGVSSCAALVGGIVLSMSKQWMSSYSEDDSLLTKSEPHLLFNVGRVAGYSLFGALLGYVGNFFRLSPSFSAMLVIAVSIVMVLLGLQMLGVKAVNKFQIKLPKSITGAVSDEKNFNGKTAPFFMGALTFFLPCGFTVTAQALALASGIPLQGALIMGLFALGTVPGLLAIGLGSVSMFSDKNKSRQFSMVAGMLVLAFSLININAQMSVLGLPSLSDIVRGGGIPKVLGNNTQNREVKDLIPMVGGKQVIKINASASGYSPNRFKIRMGVPTKMEVTDTGTSGCTNAIISKLFEGQIDLTPGEVSVKEFTPKKAGVYKFSCWMGMISGVIEVVDDTGSVGVNTTPVDTGAKGCGCGGGGAGSSCGGS